MATAPDTTKEKPADEVVEGADKIEETVTIKNSDDVKKLLEKVRAEEKKKLYPQIEHYKSQTDTLKAQNELLAKQLKGFEEEIDTTKKSKLSESEKVQAQLRELADQNTTLKKQQEALVTEYQTNLRNMELKTYAANAIAQVGGELIPELVYGDSEVEIDAAILASKQRYREIVANAKQALKSDRSKAPIPGTDGAPPRNAQGAPSGEELTAEMLAQMKPEDWAKERLNIRRQVDGTMKNFFRGK